MSPTAMNRALLLSIPLVATTLAACGGGGSGSTPTETATPDTNSGSGSSGGTGSTSPGSNSGTGSSTGTTTDTTATTGAEITTSIGYVLARKADGTLLAWGDNLALSGVSGPLVAGSSAMAIDLGVDAVDVGASLGVLADQGSFSVVGTADGSYTGWGLNDAENMPLGVYTETSGTALPPSANPASALSPWSGAAEVRPLRDSNGRGATIARMPDGSVYLMAGTVDVGNRSVAAKRIAGLGNIQRIGSSLGGGVVPLIDQVGAVQMVSQIVVPTTQLTGSQAIVSSVAGLPAVTDAACYGVITAFNCVAIDTQQHVWTWGSNNQLGQLGDGTRLVRNTPAQIVGLEHVAKIALSATNAYAVTTEGLLYGWGGYRRMGVTPTTVFSNDVANDQDALAPRLITAVGPVRSLSVGLGAGVTGTVHAVLTDGSVWGWGGNSRGELGGGTALAFSFTPVKVPGVNLN